MKVKLVDIAQVIRSKNAGPFELTLDIIFKDKKWFDAVIKNNAINKNIMSQIYKVPEQDVLSIIFFEPAAAVKITMKRPLVAGNIGETDVYGAQQHGPLLELEFANLD